MKTHRILLIARTWLAVALVWALLPWVVLAGRPGGSPSLKPRLAGTASLLIAIYVLTGTGGWPADSRWRTANDESLAIPRHARRSRGSACERWIRR